MHRYTHMYTYTYHTCSCLEAYLHRLSLQLVVHLPRFCLRVRPLLILGRGPHPVVHYLLLLLILILIRVQHHAAFRGVKPRRARLGDRNQACKLARCEDSPHLNLRQVYVCMYVCMYVYMQHTQGIRVSRVICKTNVCIHAFSCHVTHTHL
jgi:hypothetical protein